jgi:hypothetical protein
MINEMKTWIPRHLLNCCIYSDVEITFSKRKNRSWPFNNTEFRRTNMKVKSISRRIWMFLLTINFAGRICRITFRNNRRVAIILWAEKLMKPIVRVLWIIQAQVWTSGQRSSSVSTRENRNGLDASPLLSFEDLLRKLRFRLFDVTNEDFAQTKPDFANISYRLWPPSTVKDFLTSVA